MLFESERMSEIFSQSLLTLCYFVLRGVFIATDMNLINNKLLKQ